MNSPVLYQTIQGSHLFSSASAVSVFRDELISSLDLKPSPSLWPEYPGVSWTLATRHQHHPCTTVALSEIPVLRNMNSAPRQFPTPLPHLAPHSLVSAASCLAAPISDPLGKAIWTTCPCCRDKRQSFAQMQRRADPGDFGLYKSITNFTPHCPKSGHIVTPSCPHRHRHVVLISIN